MNIVVELDLDQISDIVRKDLVNAYNFTKDDEIKQALYKLIEYYSPINYWEEFKREQRRNK